ncbi:ATP-binding cassette domain-containing protein [Clostridium sp.]|uniref:ATP-binding cassette domain-containing protein n=1 Tax=Clostridium sp. TaxID=1506 RepID=UPI002849B6B7|nr:ATP-binding cassette domain-containing protein [Clostridium sp.]MDR3595877.1 ATP-binding cassette domain-containing protein [Clostridium sp.]
MNFIEIANLSKTIGNRAVLKNISISLNKGKIYGFYGRNGSGKTMLFRAICGLIKPTSGQIIIDSKILHKDISFHNSIGVLIENCGFWDNYTGFENLKQLSIIKNIINDDDIKVSMSRVGLDPNDKRVVKRYSLGMKQRLAIAQAIMEKPNLLILDEPTNAVDEEGLELIRNILLEEKLKGTTILIASHNKDDINLLCDYKYKMNDGELLVE